LPTPTNRFWSSSRRRDQSSGGRRDRDCRRRAQNSFFFSALDATGKLYVKNTSATGSIQVIIDIAGYYE
jgi:hypothetical protein